jgi:transposase
MGYLTMNVKEREQAKMFELIKLGEITQAEAAARLRISDRWVRKKLKRFYEFGNAGLIHISRGKANPRRWNLKQEQLLIELLKEEWHGFGPTFTAEKLEEFHSIKVSKETVRKAMIRANIWNPKQKRRKHRMRRERKPMHGTMVQLDGSPHDWFEGRSDKCTLLVFIDDATSQVLWLEFAPSESVEALMRATKNYIEKHGIPQIFYTDHGSVFHVNLNNQEGIKKTQWEASCKELNIEVIHAHSPQAKGRVERCNQTMQDRLVKEMRLAGISSINAANHYLRNSDFIKNHNRFSKKAAQKGNAHRIHRQYDLKDVFSIKETRVLANDFTITYHKRIYQLSDQQKTIIRPKNEIVVKKHLDGLITLWIRKTELLFYEIQERPQLLTPEVKTVKYTQPRKPSENSRRWVIGLPSQSRVKPAPQAVEAF